MKNNYKLIILQMILTFAFVGTRAQDATFKQPSRIIQLSPDESVKSSSTIFEKHLKLGKENTYKLEKSVKDRIGITHETYKQMYAGIPVEFGRATIDSKKGKNTSLHGEYYNVRNLNTSPSLSATQALQKAMDHLQGEEYMWENASASEVMNYSKPTGELLVLPNLDSENKEGVITKFNLAYKFDMYVTKPTVTRGYLYIDAMSGAPLLYDPIIKHIGEHSNSSKNLKAVSSLTNNTSILEVAPIATGNAATRYSGNRTITTRTLNGPYVLRDNTRGSGINTLNSGGTDQYPVNDFTDTDNNWTAAEYNNAAKDNAALDAHWGAEMTYDYLSAVHNRNSFDGNGAAINSWVHYDDVPGGAGLDNAYWNGSVMSYGDGSSNGNEGNGYFDALTSLDVAAHEIGHALTTYTANLAYRRESGGLNEGFSDIWGAAVEHFAKGNGNDAAPAANIWLIGDQIDRRNGSLGLRSMSNPKAMGQPDTYRGTYWQAATVEEGCSTPIGDGNDPNYNDQCGVHTNSGVLNYWFYLAVAGSGATDGVNDNGQAFSVAGIGMDKASKIAYRTLNVYLTANATFLDTRNGAIQAAKDLYGASGAEEQAVTNAWHAVGVGQPYGGNTGNASYCDSNGNNTSYFHISKVQLGTINKSSGQENGGYGDYTSVSTQLEKGNSYTVTVTPTFAGTAYNQGYSVWIDYNQDGDFDDSGEQVFTQSPTTNSPVSGSFTVPTGSEEGDTRMRVSMKYNAVASSCESFSYGEVEDYTITIGGAVSDTQAPSTPSLSASDITTSSVNLTWSTSTDNVAVTGYDVYQGGSLLGTLTETSANITGLDSDTTYTFSVRAKDAAGNVSVASNVVNVTTEAEENNNSTGGCTAGVSSFPYNQGFENTLGNWSQSSADDIDWDILSSKTPSNGTGPSAANQGNYYIYVEASGGNTNKQAIITSPCFDLSSLSEATFKFDYHMFGDAVSGSISLEASTDQGANWTTMWSETNDQGDSWNTVSIDLASYVGGGVQLRFNRTTGSTWKSDVAIDNLVLTDSADADGGDDVVENNDPCDGVAQFNGDTSSYQVGDRLIYNGTLYERGASGFVNLGPCGSAGFAGITTAPGLPANDEIRVYPVPVRDGKLNVQADGPGVKNYTIQNLLGQTVAKGTLTRTIDVNRLEAGIYILKVNNYKAKRFIVE